MIRTITRTTTCVDSNSHSAGQDCTAHHHNYHENCHPQQLALAVAHAVDDSMTNESIPFVAIRNSSRIVRGSRRCCCSSSNGCSSSSSNNDNNNNVAFAEAVALAMISSTDSTHNDQETMPATVGVAPTETRRLSQQQQQLLVLQQQQREGQEQEARAEYISVTIHKEEEKQPIGIVLKRKANRLTISSLVAGGLLESSPLRAGDSIISINSQECATIDERTAQKYIRSLSGFVTIVVHNAGGVSNLVQSMVTKLHPTDSTGIGLTGGSETSSEVIPIITTIVPHGLFASSLLNVGDRVLAVNDTSCQYLNSRATASLIANSPRTVSILTKTLPETAAVIATSSFLTTTRQRAKFLSATIYKTSKDLPLGMTYTLTKKNGKTIVTIASIEENGIFDQYTPFRVGDVIVTVNRFDLVELTRKAAKRILQQKMGFLTIVAFNIQGDARFAEAMAVKSSPTMKMGITFKSKTGGTHNDNNNNNHNNNNNTENMTTTIISNVANDSVFSQSLKIGDQVLAINDIECDGSGASHAAEIIGNATEYVKIVVKKGTTPDAGGRRKSWGRFL